MPNLSDIKLGAKVLNCKILGYTFLGKKLRFEGGPGVCVCVEMTILGHSATCGVFYKYLFFR